MNRSLHTLFEALAQGFVWVGRDLRVRHANRLAQRLLGLAAGASLAEGPLTPALRKVLAGQTVPDLRLPHPGDPSRRLAVRVMAGLGSDDCMVFLDGGDGPNDAGLDNFLSAVRAELLGPFEAWRLALSQAQKLRRDPAVQPLLEQGEALAETLAHLLELGWLWSGERLVGEDRVEVRTLIDQAWTAVQPLAGSRRLRVRVAGEDARAEQAAVYGSATWLGRVLQETLARAVRQAEPGGTLDLELTALGPRLTLVLRDCGPFPPPRTAERVLPADPGAAGARPALREQLGQKLVERVLALHGGSLREEPDGKLRSLILELPIGAPSDDLAASLQAAQVERYAADLASLLAERRRSLA